MSSSTGAGVEDRLEHDDRARGQRGEGRVEPEHARQRQRAEHRVALGEADRRGVGQRVREDRRPR